MDIAKLILNTSVSPPTPLENTSQIKNASDEGKKQAAEGFESIFVNKLLEEMKSTVGNWGFEKEEAGEQVQGIFSLYLSEYVAQNGGLGLGKDIYQYLTKPDTTGTTHGAQGKNI